MLKQLLSYARRKSEQFHESHCHTLTCSLARAHTFPSAAKININIRRDEQRHEMHTRLSSYFFVLHHHRQHGEKRGVERKKLQCAVCVNFSATFALCREREIEREIIVGKFIGIRLFLCALLYNLLSFSTQSCSGAAKNVVFNIAFDIMFFFLWMCIPFSSVGLMCECVIGLLSSMTLVSIAAMHVDCRW